MLRKIIEKPKLEDVGGGDTEKEKENKQPERPDTRQLRGKGHIAQSQCPLKFLKPRNSVHKILI